MVAGAIGADDQRVPLALLAVVLLAVLLLDQEVTTPEMARSGHGPEMGRRGR
jgi:hypothetical protein